MAATTPASERKMPVAPRTLAAVGSPSPSTAETLAQLHVNLSRIAQTDGGLKVRSRILVVDDEPAIRDSLKRALSLEGYEVELAADGNLALERMGRLPPPDAVVLDILMPGMDGLEVCRLLRRIGNRTPILMLTARDEVADRVEGLDAGADDYLVKPFALEELLGRIRALLRRHGTSDDGGILQFDDLTLDPGAHRAQRGEREFELTRTEFLLLEQFMLHPRRVLTRSFIFDQVWGYDFGPASNSLEVYIGYLRRKTEAGGEPRLIHTIRGVGYVLREPVGVPRA
jgi:two-component system, OmpR family, response regulator MprA